MPVPRGSWTGSLGSDLPVRPWNISHKARTRPEDLWVLPEHPNLPRLAVRLQLPLLGAISHPICRCPWLAPCSLKENSRG